MRNKFQVKPQWKHDKVKIKDNLVSKRTVIISATYTFNL